MKLLCYFLLAFSCAVTADQLTDYAYQHNQLTLKTNQGELRLKFARNNAVYVELMPSITKHVTSSYAFTAGDTEPVKANFVEQPSKLILSTSALAMHIQKRPFKLSFVHQKKRIAEQIAVLNKAGYQGFQFSLQPKEQILGGGERVLGMNRRGFKLPLYNKAHYGYSDYSEQMNFGLPAVISSQGYAVLYDNPAKGYIDIGKSQQDVLAFASLAGKQAYMLVYQPNPRKLTENIVELTGFQPMLPRWALGSFASRFGYHSQQEAEKVVQLYQKFNIGLDAIVFDIFWFGKDIQGYMGNLEWDKTAFPTPEKMISRFKKQGIQTIPISEPFVLTSSKNWQSAVNQKALAVNNKGLPKTFDFYFGNTGLIDVFSKSGQQWFSQFYQTLLRQGIEGFWGDLGEPEVHPSDALHAAGSADEIHNVYGHQWAKLIYQTQQQFNPNLRPFILMRAGFLGSQRYGMVPWTGDVSRSWPALAAQPELSLQMGLFGLAYTHSDLGGFAGDNHNEKLYQRWLQYGVFQPIFRPHAQEIVPPEPVFHPEPSLSLARDAIALRYAMLPYNYTLVYDNATKGTPLMRPLFWYQKQPKKWIFEQNSYLWGDDLLIRPIFKADSTAVKVNLPPGNWYDFFNPSKLIQGEQQITTKVVAEHIPVFVRAGSFIPMISPILTTQNYQHQKVKLHYYPNNIAREQCSKMYDDDGKSANAIQTQHYEILRFCGMRKQNELQLTFSAQRFKGYSQQPESRNIELLIHVPKFKRVISINQTPVAIVDTEQAYQAEKQVGFYDQQHQQLKVKFNWRHQNLMVKIR